MQLSLPSCVTRRVTSPISSYSTFRRSLYQAQIDLVAAERDELLNTVDLALAMGGGLGPHAEAPRAARR